VTLASVNVNFQFVVAQGHSKEEMEMRLLTTLAEALKNVPSVVEFDVLPGTQTKVDPFTAAPVITFGGPIPLALR